MRPSRLIVLSLIFSNLFISNHAMCGSGTYGEPSKQSVFSIVLAGDYQIPIHQPELYFQSLNTLSIQIQRLAESQITTEFDRQQKTVEQLKDLINADHSCPLSNEDVATIREAIETVQRELDRYTTLMEYVYRIHQRIMVDLTSFQQYCGPDDFVLFIDRIGIRENTRLMNDLSEDSTLIHVDH